MDAKPAFTSRPYHPETDLPAMAELINYVGSVEQLDESTSPDDLRQWFKSPGIDPGKNIRLWEEASGRLVAVAVLITLAPTEISIDGRLTFYIHPRAAQSGLDDEVIAWAGPALLEHGASRGLPCKLLSGALEHYKGRREALERNGFTLARHFFVMHRPLDEPLEEPRFPEGFTLSNVAEHPDVDRYVEMYNLSFVDHWNFHPMLPERRTHVMNDPRYRPEG
ncbi:MAG: GNAT family N-acetyltransferase, partial [Chloroflexota bacterium]|nr:GNAT family N-acetyltransferase [Chloroflexota bacterium]